MTMAEPDPISADRAEHFAWGQGCDGWRLVQTEKLSVIEERMPMDTWEVAHHHRVAHQFFYVLHGVLTMVVAGKEIKITAGSGLEISPRTVHQARNTSCGDVRFLVISQPPTEGDRIEMP